MNIYLIIYLVGWLITFIFIIRKGKSIWNEYKNQLFIDSDKTRNSIIMLIIVWPIFWPTYWLYMIINYILGD